MGGLAKQRMHSNSLIGGLRMIAVGCGVSSPASASVVSLTHCGLFHRKVTFVHSHASNYDE
jgi:hypothetical protein